MTRYVAEEGIPIPEALPGRPGKYPFRAMKVGDSFVIKPEDGRPRVACAANQYSLRNPGPVFRTGIDADGNARLWRIA